MPLLGPADAEAFRDWVQGVGRVYVDPLDGCSIADKTDAWWPSISAVKNADKSDWTGVLIKRMAKLPAEEWHRIAELGLEERKQAMRAVNSHDLNVASGRGTIIHWWAEDLLYGRPMRKLSTFDLDIMERPIPHESLEIAELYKPALVDLFRTYDPELVAAEYVGIHRTLNGVGYGGTGDGIVRFKKTKPGVYGIDWKSRDITSAMRAYPPEGAQIAASVNAEYVIVDDGNGGAKRAEVPEVDGAVIVSIRPDGARVYPAPLDAAWTRFQRIHQWWIWRQEEKDVIGRVWPVVRTQDDLLDKIQRSTTQEALVNLFLHNKTVWTEDHTKAAAKRKAELAA